MTDRERDFVRKWFSLPGEPRQFVSFAEGAGTSTTALTTLLSIKADELGGFGQEIIRLDPRKEPLAEHLESFRRGVQGYLQFQDLLPVQLDMVSPMENRHYAYFESIAYLREATVSLLNRRALSALVMIRPFMELSVTHLYFMEMGGEKGFEHYYEWIAGEKNKPPFRSMLDQLLDRLSAAGLVDQERYDMLRTGLTEMYSSSSMYHHSPRQKESIVVLSGGVASTGLMPFMYAVADLTILMRQMLFLYVLANPMAMFPVDIPLKFGYSPPVGVFVDGVAHQLIVRAIGEGSADALKAQLEDSEEVKSKLEWYHHRASKSKADLEADWARFATDNNFDIEADTPEKRWLIAKAQMRSFAWAFSYLQSPESFEDLSDEAARLAFERLMSW